jgi:hypothetical protein
MKIYEMKITKETDVINCISLVEKPATEMNFLKLAQEKLKLSFDDEKQEVTGVVLIPNQLIDRVANNELYQIFMTAETIKQLSIMMFDNNSHNAVDLQHSGELIGGVRLVESWIVEDGNNDKSNALGLGVLEKGTWVQTKKIDNVELWNETKQGKYNGFSIEALLTPIETDENEILLSKVVELLKS